MQQCWVIWPDHIEHFRIFRSNFWVAVLEMLQSDPTLVCTGDAMEVPAAAGQTGLASINEKAREYVCMEDMRRKGGRGAALPSAQCGIVVITRRIFGLTRQCSACEVCCSVSDEGARRWLQLRWTCGERD